MRTMNRRSALKNLRAGLFVASGVSLTGCVSAGNDVLSSGSTETICIAVISDTHIRRSSRDELTDLTDQRHRYEEFVTAMNTDVRPDFVVHLGDLIDGRSPDNDPYCREDTAVRRISKGKRLIHDRLSMPTYTVMGNHEYKGPNWDRDRIRRTINDQWTRRSDTWYCIDRKGVRFLFLNTSCPVTNHRHHAMPAEEFAWLCDILEDTDRPLVAFMHVPATQGCGDRYDQFEREDEVRRLFSSDKNPNVITGIFGHSHHSDSWNRLRSQHDEYGTMYYHTSNIHEWMGDSSQIPWAVLKIDLQRDRFRFSAGAGVTDSGEYRTTWIQSIAN